MSKEAAEELCSFADYNNNGTINIQDWYSCSADIVPSINQVQSQFSIVGGSTSPCIDKTRYIPLFF